MKSKNEAPVEPAYFTYKQAAKYTGLSEVTLWRWVRAGRLTLYGPTKRAVRFRKDELDQLMQPHIKDNPLLHG